jgi:MFS family permease
LQGASSGPVYTFAPEITGDIFFHHERGRAMVAYTMCLAAGPFIAGVSGGYIAAALGYRWLFWISAILVAFTLVLEVLIVPETLFDRAYHLRQEEDEGNTTSPGLKNESTTKENIAESDRTPQPAWSYVQSLKCGMYRGNIGHHFLAPWLSLLFPGTWVVMLLYGGLVAAIVTTATVGPIFLSQPPYLWKADVGLINFGGLIGVVVGGAITFFTSDWLVTLAAKRDSNGLSEPETRLVSLFPGIFLAVTGLWTFGFCAANPSPNAWAGLAVGGGMISAATTTVPSIGFNYVRIFSCFFSNFITDKILDHRLLQACARRLLRHDNHRTRCRCFRLDVFHHRLDYCGWPGASFRHLWYDHGDLWVVGDSAVALWQACEDCDGQVPAGENLGSAVVG